MQRKKARTIILIVIMILVDIFIKVIIDNFFMERTLIINNWIGFLPFLNLEQLSIFNNELELGLDLIYLNIINIVGIVVLILARNRLKKEKEWSVGIDIGTIMVLAGAYCSLIDKLFWNGSLDYILFFSTIVDLKDIYMFIGLAICILDLCRQGVKTVIECIKKRNISRNCSGK